MQQLDNDEMYVDYSSSNIEFRGASVGQLESGAWKKEKVRTVKAENMSRTLIGTDIGIKRKTEVG